MIPASSPGTEVINSGGTLQWFIGLDEMELAGHGINARSCGALACARCYVSVPQKPEPDGQIDPRCWLCGGKVDVFTE